MYLFTSESVAPGHPDKCADIIADTIVDYLLKHDPRARIPSEVFLAGRHIIIGGEVTTTHPVDTDTYRGLVREALVKIGYTGNGFFSKTECLHPDEVHVTVHLNQQSPDINQGVDQASGETGAGLPTGLINTLVDIRRLLV